jgi:hypothetical protein
MKKYFLFLMVLIFSCSSNNNVLNDVRIIKYSNKPPFISGFISTWIEITVENTDKYQIKCYKAYLQDNEVLPNIGDYCTIHYHIHDISGFVGDVENKILNAKVIDKIITDR